MKKFLIVPIWLIAVIGVAACGTTTTTKTATTTKTVAGGASADSTGPTQMLIGTKVGQDYVRVQQAFAARARTVPTLYEFVSNFALWVQGKATGREIPEDLKAAGFATDPAPTKPLPAVARKAAADVALRYVAHARSARYGALNGGYTVAYRDGMLQFRCKAPAIRARICARVPTRARGSAESAHEASQS